MMNRGDGAARGDRQASILTDGVRAFGELEHGF